MSMLMTNMLNVFVSPSFGAILKSIIDICVFFSLGLGGGFIGAASFIDFEKDKLTYHHAGLQEFDLFKHTMVFIKTIMFSILGRPNFMKDADPENTPP